MLEDSQDAFGHVMSDLFNKKEVYEIVERDDGFISPSPGPDFYFSEYENWWESEKASMAYVSGKVLDIGCGAGRHSLYLQGKGFEVVGVDNSPLAIDVCKARGLRDARVVPITRLSLRLGIFDTILMLGNNFSLVGSIRRAKWLLDRFYHMTSESGIIIAQTRDPYQTDEPEHLAYHARNREHGRMTGAVKIKVRYKKYATPWIEFLMFSKNEMKDLIAHTNWQIRNFIDDREGIYITILEKLLAI